MTGALIAQCALLFVVFVVVVTVIDAWLDDRAVARLDRVLNFSPAQPATVQASAAASGWVGRTSIEVAGDQSSPKKNAAL